MRPQVMISSVVRDTVQLGDVEKLKNIWFAAEGFAGRLKAARCKSDPKAHIPFSFVRAELKRHLEGKYGFETYIFEESGGAGGAAADETIVQAVSSQLVVAIFGSTLGAKIADQDALTPTLREWRVALQTPLKLRLFWLKGSQVPDSIGPLGEVLHEITDYKKGKIYAEFSDLVDLCIRVDRAVQGYIHTAVVRYVADTVTKEPGSETEDWLLSPYKERVAKMGSSFKKVAESLGAFEGRLPLEELEQPITLYCVPDGFSIPESRKFTAYVFETEAEGRTPGDMGKLHFIACFGGVTDAQIRRHLGNFESAQVFRGPWGFYASEQGSGIQCVYLPYSTNSLVIQHKMTQTIDWLKTRGRQLAELAQRRQEILDVIGARSPAKGKPVRSTQGSLRAV